MTKPMLFFATSFLLTTPLLASPTSPNAPEVIDLGRLKVEGAARGPEVRLIDGGRLDATTSERLVFGELEGVERRLLGLETAEPPVKTAKRPSKGRKP